MSDILLLAAVVYFAIFTQAISGFGLALISMPLLVPVLTPVPAAALVALMAITTQVVMLSKYRRELRIGALWRLAIGSIAGIPLGVIALANLNERLILTLLGVILIAYSLYSLISPRLPVITNLSWGYGFGFVSGLLGGAYNTGGPPFVIYGMCQCWEPTEFKANLQGLLMVNSSMVVVAHLLAGHYTPFVLQNYAVALPMILLGAGTGFWLDKHINEAVFRKIVLVLLLLIGLKMLLM